jgi:hypothetical protein
MLGSSHHVDPKGKQWGDEKDQDQTGDTILFAALIKNI